MAAQEALTKELGSMDELNALKVVLGERNDPQGLHLVSNMILAILADSPEYVSEDLLNIVISKLNSSSPDLLEILSIGADYHRDYLLKHERLKSLLLKESAHDGNVSSLAVALLPKVTMNDKAEFQLENSTQDAKDLAAELVKLDLLKSDANTLHLHLVNKLLGGFSELSVEIGKYFIFAETISAVAGAGALRPARVIAACELLRCAVVGRDGVMEALRELLKCKKRKDPMMANVHAAVKRVISEISETEESLEMTIFEFLERGVFDTLASFTNPKSAEALARSWLAEPGNFSSFSKLTRDAFSRAQHSLPFVDHQDDFSIERSLRVNIKMATGSVTILADPIAPVRSIISFTSTDAKVRVTDASGAELDLNAPLCLAVGRSTASQAAVSPLIDDTGNFFYAWDETEIVTDQAKFEKSHALSRASQVWSKTHHLICSAQEVGVVEPLVKRNLEIVTLDRMGQFLARLDELVKSPLPDLEIFSKTLSTHLRVISIISLFAQVFHVHADFFCLEISAKVEAILSSPLRCATGDFPQWVEGIVLHAPAILSLTARKQLLALRAFGLPRALHLGSQPRQKVKISRESLTRSAAAALQATACRPDYLVEFEFTGEAGSGSGPTSEFYSLIPAALKETCEGMFIKSALEHCGKLFPAPGKDFGAQWRMLGHLTARAMTDSRLVDLDFHPIFWEICKSVSFSPSDCLSELDPQLYKSLAQLHNLTRKELKNLEICTQTCPGVESLRLQGVEGVTVHAGNLKSYTEAVASAIVYDGVISSVTHFIDAFNEIFPLSTLLSLVRPEEISRLYLGSTHEDHFWTAEAVAAAIHPGHGLTADSAVFKWTVEGISDLSTEERSLFTRFVTGSHILPAGGFAGLRPPLTVARAVVDGCLDSFLPSVMTCANFLKVPEYSSKERLMRQLRLAITEGQGSFHLS